MAAVSVTIHRSFQSSQVIAMNRNAKFWVFLSLFQLAFGWTVFAVTRHFYIQDSGPAAPPGTASHPTGAGLPETGPGSEMEQLIDLFPAQPASQDPAEILIQADNQFAQAQYGPAAQGYARLIEMGIRNADIYNNLGITLHYLGRSDEALKVLDDGISLDPSYQRIWLTSGFVNSQAGQIEEARAALSKARDLAPNSEVGRAASQMLEQLGG